MYIALILAVSTLVILFVKMLKNFTTKNKIKINVQKSVEGNQRIFGNIHEYFDIMDSS
jgi:ABC-type phosphate transport system auxiliary subunit